MMMATKTWVLGGLVAVAASGCTGCFGENNTPVDDPNGNLPTACQSTAPEITPPKLDVLFVIDNSNSMREEQDAVARELTAFIDELSKGGGVSTDFNIGVITTAVYQQVLFQGTKYYRDYPGQAGRLQPVPNVLADGGLDIGTGSERLLKGNDPNLIDKFQRLVRVGTSGSGQETPFEAIRLALSPPLITTDLANNGNQEFLRDGARLLIVVLTDEDDCSEMVRPPRVIIGDQPNVNECTGQAASLATVREYFDFLHGLTNADGKPKDIIYTAIAPVGVSTKAAQEIIDMNQVRNVDCPTSNQAGYRMRTMAELWDSSLVNLDSICRASFRETLITIASLANVSQVLEVSKVPDPNLLQVRIVRGSGQQLTCTMARGLEGYTEGVGGAKSTIRFGADCQRRADDLSVDIRMLCIE
jgi:hypothetical protein